MNIGNKLTQKYYKLVNKNSNFYLKKKTKKQQTISEVEVINSLLLKL